MKAHKMRFDTHQYVKNAEAAGFTHQQAEFQAAELFKLLGDTIENKLDQLVTRHEFDHAVNKLTDLENKLDRLVTRDEFDHAVNKLTNEMVSKADFNYEIKLVHKDIQILDTKINTVDSKLTWLVSMFGIASVFLGIISLLHGFHLI